MTKPKRTDKARMERDQLERGRDEGVAWAVAFLVNAYGTSTESKEMAACWGMDVLLSVADPTDLPHLQKLCKDEAKQFRGCRARALRAQSRKKGKP